MRIDYIANVRMPTEKAHGGQIIKMCEAWGENHEIILWAPKRFNHLKGDPFEFYCARRNFKIKKIFCFDLLPLSGILGPVAFFAENISFAFLAALRVFFKKTDMIFCRDFWSAYFLSLLGKKVAYEIHDLPNRHFITRHGFSKINKFVVTNRYKAEDLIKTFGIKKENICVAQNGVDADIYCVSKSKEELRRELGLPQNKKVALYSGHLYSWKGADIFLEAALKLNKNIAAVFVGGLEKDVADFRSRAGSADNIFICGYQEYKQIPGFLAASDVLILPNTAKEKISLQETSPLKLFEYMAAGRPIVASDIPSIREIVSDAEAVFFKADDVDDLKRKIEMVLENPGAYQEMLENAKKLVAEYSWKNRALKILKFLCYDK